METLVFSTKLSAIAQCAGAAGSLSLSTIIRVSAPIQKSNVAMAWMTPLRTKWKKVLEAIVVAAYRGLGLSPKVLYSW